MLKTGFIGAGRRASSAHYPSLHRIEEVSLEAVAELSDETLTDALDIDGTVAMHRHFAECVRNGVAPSSDIRDVIETSHLVDRMAGKA